MAADQGAFREYLNVAGFATALTAAEAEQFESHLRPQVEAGAATTRLAIAYLHAER